MAPIGWECDCSICINAAQIAKAAATCLNLTKTSASLITNAMHIFTFQVFLDLAETRSFTKAAQVNGVTQSAVSQQVSSLERQFKCQLVERSKKLFRLTREGETLYEFSKRIVALHDGLQARMQEVKAELFGTIRVSAIYSIGLHDLPPYVKLFLQRHPTVKVQVDYQRADQVYARVLDNLSDLGLVGYPAEDHRLGIVRLRNEPLAVICHPQHPFAQLKSVKVKALHGQKMIAFEPDIPTRVAVDRLLRRRRVRVEHTMEFDNVETVKQAVETDTAVAVVPLSTVTQEVAKGTLAAVKLDDPDAFRPVAAIYKRGRPLTPAMKQFIGLLKEPL